VIKILKRNIVFATIKNIRITLLPKHKRVVSVLFLLVFASAIFEVLGLALVLPVINIAIHPTIVENNSIVNFVFTALGFVSKRNFSFFLFSVVTVFFLLKNVTLLFVSYYQSYFTSTISGEIGHDLFKRYYKRDVSFFNDVNSFEILRNVTTVPVEFASNILIPLIIFFNELFVVLILIVGVAIYNFQIFLLLLITIIPSFYLIFKFTKNKIVESAKKRKDEYLLLNKRANDAVKGYIDIKLLGKENYFFDEYIATQTKMAKSNATMFSINQTSSKAIEVVSIFSIFLVLTIAILNYNTQQGLLNIMTFFLVASYRLLPSLNKMIISLNNIKGFQYVFEILNVYKNVSTTKEQNQTEQLVFDKKLNISNVLFKYPNSEKVILNNLSIEIKKGETIGIIGSSGSGKTTLINIILGFLKAQEGCIKMDDVVISDSNLLACRNIIGYVKQNVFILDGTITENIAVGINTSEINIDKINETIRLTKLQDFVHSLPNGINTQIGEQGSKLSGGQKQRIAIARALYHNAEILIFDEATSALDNETEREITESIESLVGNKTMIIVAHRYSTLKNCNRVIEMKDGKVIQELTYEQLIKSKL
jgi:ABC-type multidrug transport system fused ATPase/permease subunit